MCGLSDADCQAGHKAAQAQSLEFSYSIDSLHRKLTMTLIHSLFSL